ncbi:unnamed protein product [Lymnaea stagnalis]|uniref:Mitochondrial genome maintenance exonuclease 1 n=1 Tax=Lymnaea stagnalis TaxID=6523 RepID=A0AAV2I752_LYMST
MALIRHSSTLCLPWKLLAVEFKSIHLSTRLNKKYDYDLDSLIQFKKETTLVFGAERKLTKTGKLRKKKVDSKINDYLQVLSAYSTQDLNDFQTNQNLDIEFDGVENYQEGQDQLLELTTNKSSPVTRNSKSKFKTKRTTNLLKCASEDFENKDKSDIECTTEEIPIPKISAVPLSQTYVKKLQEKRQKKVVNNFEEFDANSLQKSSDIHFTKAESELQLNSSIESSNDLSINNQSEKTMSFDTKTLNDEILIPKMAPIPDEKTHFPVSEPFKIAVSQSQTHHLKSFINLPIEPPSSFDVILKVPLFSNESTSWQTNLDFHEFQKDIEQMELRTSPSVKTILSKTMPETNRFFLNRWRENMIKELGDEGFKKHQDATIRKGVNLHANIMEFLSKKPINEIQIMPENEGHWASLQSVFQAVSGVAALEVEVFHSYLFYRGVFDCIGRYKDLLCIIDWKTSKKSRPLLKNTYDDPLQIVAYMGAINSNDRYTQKFGEVNYGMIVVAYTDGSPAHIHLMNRTTCEVYWKDWTDRLYNFYQLTYTEKVGTKKISHEGFPKKIEKIAA